ncbi:MAG: TetR/AcrR family transcriptional regulator [Bdellovibrionales bacterium]|nr:TetR/AcrR family transcriptional regulator [Bdellovibrionales bacterium]
MGRPKCFNREQVLADALPLFLEKGFADTSVQDLERATGVNKSGLYSEFEDKEDLYLSSLAQYVENPAAAEVLSAKPLGWANVERFLRMAFECRAQKGCFVVNSVRELSILPPRAKSIITNHLKRVRGMLVDNLEGKTKADPGVVADIILTFNSGTSLEQNLRSLEKSGERVDVFMRMLRSL